MSILVNTGFEVGSAEPLNKSSIKETVADRDALVTNGLVYEGMKVYCKDTKLEYRYTGAGWDEIGSGTGSSYDDTEVRRLIDTNKTNIATNATNITELTTKIGNETMDTTATDITGAIKEVNGNLLDNVSFSADYKNIVLNRKNGTNPYTIPISAIINNAKLIELGDVDVTDIGNEKTLVYDAATQKHKYVDSTGTDELVKMDSTGDAHYLADLLDKQTIINDNGTLKVKKLDGQEVTIAEINYLKGLTMNVMDLVNMFSNGGVKIINTPVNTYAELLTFDKTDLIDDISYLIYVLADETHDNAKTTYLIDKTTPTPTYFGFAGEHRDFTTNPIDLANEVTGKLGTSNIDVDSLWALLTIDDTYKTLTTTNNAFGTHGAKAMYDELTTSISAKANTTDLTTHTDDTDIHVTTTDKERWDGYDATINQMKTNFQDGVNTIYDSVVARGVTPVDKSPSSISKSIGDIGSVKMDLLWSNPNPKTSFTSRKISLDLSEYSLIVIKYRENINTSVDLYFVTNKISGMKVGLGAGYYSNGWYRGCRFISVLDDGVSIGEYDYGAIQNDSIAIPIAIYGMYTDIFKQ